MRSEAGHPVLPSWRDGAAKRAILDFVTRVTTVGHPDYVPPVDRIAVFDNDALPPKWSLLGANYRIVAWCI